MMNLTELPNDFIHEPPEGYVTKLTDFKKMWLLFGYGITASMLTLLMMLGLFGDLSKQNEEGKEALRRLTINASLK